MLIDVEEIEPLNSLEIQEGNDRDVDTTLEVQQNIIKLSNQFGICFKGCVTSFKNIDNSRQASRRGRKGTTIHN